MRRGRRILRDGVVDGGGGKWVDVDVRGTGVKFGTTKYGRFDAFSFLSCSHLSSILTAEGSPRRSFSTLPIASLSSLSFRFSPLTRVSVSLPVPSVDLAGRRVL